MGAFVSFLASGLVVVCIAIFFAYAICVLCAAEDRECVKRANEAIKERNAFWHNQLERMKARHEAKKGHPIWDNPQRD